jgi:ABC-type multidrug transport system fused ATPase/permease subunit
MKSFVSKIYEIYRPFRKIVLVMFVFLAFSEALMLVSPYLYGKIIDAVIAKKEMSHVLVLASLALLVYILQNVFLNYYRERFEIKNFDFDVSRHVAKSTLQKVLAFSIGQHVNENSGIKQSVINRGEHSLSTLAYTTLYDILPIALQVILTTVALIYLNVVLGLIVLFSVLLFVGLTLYTNHIMKDDLKKFQDIAHDNNKMHSEILRNVEVVQINAQEKKSINEYDGAYGKFSLFGKKMWSKYTLFASLRNLTTGLARFAIIVVGVYYVYQGKYTPGYLVVFLTWSSNTFGRLGMVGGIHRRSMELYSAVKKYFVMTDTEPDVKNIKNPVKPEKYNGKIEFRNVSFSYPMRKYLEDEEELAPSPEAKIFDALDCVNFTIEPGQKVAFVGHSGAGKSTIVRLLTRAYDPDNGQIIVDGNDLRIIDLKHFRENLGVVEQDVSLFDNTLRYNICFGLNGRSSSVTNKDLDEVAKLSCVDKFQHRLERGFDTIIGEKGIKLSGGERQRVGIARALIKDPQILIFDEATSHLDTENEMLIRQSIERAAEGRTTILIAHRLSTIKNADKIFVLDKGKIVGEGRHEELAATCHEYQKLIQNQTVMV